MKLSDFRYKPSVAFTWGDGYTKWRFVTSCRLEKRIGGNDWEHTREIPLDLAFRDDLHEVPVKVKVERWGYVVVWQDGTTSVLSYTTSEEAQKTHANNVARGNRCSEIQRVEYTVK